MYERKAVETKGRPDREKSKSSLSLQWEDICGAPIDLQGFAESCWNNLKTVEIDLDGTKNLELKSILDKPLLQDSGNSSLNDEDQSSISDRDTNGQCQPPISVKAFVEQFSQGVTFKAGYGKWNLVVQELIDTESAYLSSLKEVDEGYLKMASGKFRDNDEVHVIFSNWSLLCGFHSRLLRQMKEATRPGFEGLNKLAQCFINDVKKFETLYGDYCINYSKSIKHLNNIEQVSSVVWEYLVECQSRLGHQLPLSTFLLKPVQRILKYQLLLQELIHSCSSMPPSESEKVLGNLHEAMKEMVGVASRINERKTEQDEMTRQIQLRNELYAEILSSNPCFPNLGHPRHDGELKMPGSRNVRVALLCEHALVLAKRLGNRRWEIKQMIKCEKMMLFEYIPKQPLGFYMADLNNPKSKSKVLALTKEDKDVWCTKIKELIIGTYDAGLISERSKRILLENKQNALAMAEAGTDLAAEAQKLKLNPEEDLLDLETTLRRMLDPTTEHRFVTSRNISIKRRNSVGLEKTDLKTNFRDPSIYQRTNRGGQQRMEACRDLDCRSITVEINEEALEETGLGVVSMQTQTYERYIEVARTKIRLTPEDIDEIFLPFRQLSVSKDGVAPLADIEMLSFCSDQESIGSDRPVSSGRHRKAASMDRTFGLAVSGKTCSLATTLDLDGLHREGSSEDGHRKKSLFSSVRGTKATRSSSEWCATVDAEIRPGIVKRLFRASSKFSKRDKAKTGPDLKTSVSVNDSALQCQKPKSHLNKSNSTDHIVQSPFLSQKSPFSKKFKAPTPPFLSRVVKESSIESPAGNASFNQTLAEMEELEQFASHPVKPPRKLLQSRVDLFSTGKCSSSEGLAGHLYRQTDHLDYPCLLEPTAISLSESPSPLKVKALVTIFQSEK